MGDRPAPLFTRSFVLACLVAFTAFSSFYLLLATLPSYIVDIGGTESEVGLIIGVFSATAVLLRLWVGRAADARGARWLILAGALVLAIASVLYASTRTVAALLAVRVLHGAGWAAFGTAASALVANLAPAARRGEAMGYYGMFSNLAMATGPALGVALVRQTSYPLLFAAAALMAALAVALAAGIREPPIVAGPASEKVHALVEPSALLPSTVFGIVTVSYGTIVSFVPLYAAQRGITNPGVFFTAYAVTLASARSFTGKLSDRYGRPAVIIPGILAAATALALLAFARSLPTFLVAAVLYGLAYAALQPAILALVTDRAPPGRRGIAMGTFTTAIDLGIGGGSLLGGIVAEHAGYRALYLSAVGVVLVALALFVATERINASGARRPDGRSGPTPDGA